MAEVLGIHFSSTISGSVSDTGYSIPAYARWFPDQSDGEGIFNRVLESAFLLLVGECDFAGIIADISIPESLCIVAHGT